MSIKLKCLDGFSIDERREGGCAAKVAPAQENLSARQKGLAPAQGWGAPAQENLSSAQESIAPAQGSPGRAQSTLARAQLKFAPAQDLIASAQRCLDWAAGDADRAYQF
jgi:hypothetical protein